MSSGNFGLMCCICFTGLTPETCAVDIEGTKWDTCKGQCALDAGVTEQSPDLTNPTKDNS